MSVDRTCTLCNQAIAQDAPITLCPGCGTLYHDACYVSPASCNQPTCEARAKAMAAPFPNAEPSRDPSIGSPYGWSALEARALSLERQGLPNRVKSGEFTANGLSLETAGGRCNVSWERVEFLTLGIIEEAVGDAQAQRSGLRNMVRKLFFGDNQSEQQRIRKVRDIFLLDLFVSGQLQPYRFDGTTVNYRSFLGQVSYASHRNFQRLLTHIVYHSEHTRVDGSIFAMLSGQREKVRRYGGVYDFELESSQNRDRLDEQILRRELKIETDRLNVSWASDAAAHDSNRQGGDGND